jgi:hypothetical protein
MGNGEHDLPFKIELWDDADTRIKEVIALTADLQVPVVLMRKR